MIAKVETRHYQLRASDVDKSNVSAFGGTHSVRHLLGDAVRRLDVGRIVTMHADGFVTITARPGEEAKANAGC